jgi:hypothetical protein
VSNHSGYSRQVLPVVSIGSCPPCEDLRLGGDRQKARVDADRPMNYSINNKSFDQKIPTHQGLGQPGSAACDQRMTLFGALAALLILFHPPSWGLMSPVSERRWETISLDRISV